MRPFLASGPSWTRRVRSARNSASVAHSSQVQPDRCTDQSSASRVGALDPHSALGDLARVAHGGVEQRVLSPPVAAGRPSAGRRRACASGTGSVSGPTPRTCRHRSSLRVVVAAVNVPGPATLASSAARRSRAVALISPHVSSPSPRSPPPAHRSNIARRGPRPTTCRCPGPGSGAAEPGRQNQRPRPLRRGRGSARAVDADSPERMLRLTGRRAPRAGTCSGRGAAMRAGSVPRW